MYKPELVVGMPFADNQYLLGEQLGSGASSVVHRGVSFKTREPVALKIFTDMDYGRLAVHEAQIHESLHHPRIIELHTTGQADGFPYMDLELAEEDLSMKLRREGKPPVSHGVETIQSVLAAVNHAHNAGIIHGDIKPSNILVTKDGDKVADWGVARRIGADIFYSHDNSGHNTPRYSAPELYSGVLPYEGSDIYSTGVVAYEIFTGKAPFLGSDDDVIQGHLSQDPPPFSTHIQSSDISDVLIDLESVVAKALQKDPDQRPRSMREFHELFEETYTKALERESKDITTIDLKT